MNYLSVCSGIEAASVAWHPLGWNCVGVSEIEPFPSAVLAHHYPSIPNFGDMTKFKEWKINGTVDLLVGGTPCQSFSVAGLRQGLKDPRGNLMLTFLAIAEHFKPKWILWENVFGVLSSNGGKDFGCLLGGLGELGYGFAYRVLDAQWCRTHRHPRAVPQRRRRVFVVGCAGDHISAAKVLFERESLSRYSAPRRATREGTAVDVEASVATCWWDGENTASTLTKSNANGAQRMPDKDNFGAVLQPVAIPIMPQAMQSEGWRVGKENQDGRGNGLGVHASTMQVRRLTPTECERLQGFPDGWTAIPWKKKPADQCPDGPRYKALGNSMAVNCMEWLGERIQAVESGTL